MIKYAYSYIRETRVIITIEKFSHFKASCKKEDLMHQHCKVYNNIQVLHNFLRCLGLAEYFSSNLNECRKRKQKVAMSGFIGKTHDVYAFIFSVERLGLAD